LPEPASKSDATSTPADGGLIAKFLSGGQELTTPDVTKAQALAIAQAAIAVVVVLGFDLADDVKNAIITLSVALAAALPVSDAVVRQARARNARGITEARLLARRRRARPGALAPGLTPSRITPEQHAHLNELRKRLAALEGEFEPRPAEAQEPERAGWHALVAILRRLRRR
jgi:hypothetical protein